MKVKPKVIPKERRRKDMSTQEQARALMIRHYHLVKNRHLSMLERAGQEVGLTGEVSQYWQPIQGKIDSGNKNICDRSNAAMS